MEHEKEIGLIFSGRQGRRRKHGRMQAEMNEVMLSIT